MSYFRCPMGQQAEVRLSIERERAVREERSRVDQLEELRSVAELENELLKEMVAAEQARLEVLYDDAAR